MDYTPPNISVPILEETTETIDWWEWEYWENIGSTIEEHIFVSVHVQAEDLSGISSFTTTYSGYEGEEEVNLVLDDYGWWKGVVVPDMMTHIGSGYEIITTAYDSNQNMQQNIQRGGGLEEITAGLSWAMMYSTDSMTNGLMSGIFQGFVGAVFSELDFFLHMEQILEIFNLIKEILDAMIDGVDPYHYIFQMMYDGLNELVSRLNPYPEGSDHDLYKHSFFAGYIGGIILEMVVAAYVIGGAFGVADDLPTMLKKVGGVTRSKIGTAINAFIEFSETNVYAGKIVNTMRWLKATTLKGAAVLSTFAQRIIENTGLVFRAGFAPGQSFGSTARALKMAARASLTWSDDGVRGLSRYMMRNGAGETQTLVTTLGAGADDVFKGVGRGLISETDDMAIWATRIDNYAARTSGNLIDEMDDFINRFLNSFDDPDFADGIRHVTWEQKAQIADDMLRIANGEPIGVYRYTGSEYLDDLISEGRYNTIDWQNIDSELNLWREEKGIYTALDDATAQAEVFKPGEYIKTSSSYSSNQPNYGLFPSARDGNGINLVDYNFLDDAGHLTNNFDDITVYVQQGNREIPVLISDIKPAGNGYNIPRLGLEYDSIDSLIDDFQNSRLLLM